MAWAGFSIITRGASLSFTGVSLDEYGESPLAVYSDAELTTAVETPLTLADDPTVVYIDLGAATSREVWLTFGQPDGTAINRQKQATPLVTLSVDPTPSVDNIIQDTSRIDGVVDALEADIDIELALKANLVGDADLVITTSSAGLILTDTASQAWRVTVNSDGSLATSTASIS